MVSTKARTRFSMKANSVRRSFFHRSTTSAARFMAANLPQATTMARSPRILIWAMNGRAELTSVPPNFFLIRMSSPTSRRTGCSSTTISVSPALLAFRIRGTTGDWPSTDFTETGYAGVSQIPKRIIPTRHSTLACSVASRSQKRLPSKSVSMSSTFSTLSTNCATAAASVSVHRNLASAGVFMALSPTSFELARLIVTLMIRRFIYALILIFSAYAATAAQDSTLAASSPTPNPPNTEKITFTEVNVDGPYIAMTFDDGPHATNTSKLLEMAAQRHIKLTFFVLGECVAQNPDVLRREVAEGHEIGNHSWSHPNLAKLSDAGLRTQLQRTQDLIVKTASITPKLMRPPYGELTKRQRILVNREFGYKVILWDVDPLDWKRPGSDVVAQRIIAGARPGLIILSHDIHPPTIAAMPEVFDALLAKGSNS